MGWGVNAPEPTVESIIATAEAMAEVAEYAIIQQPVPWTRLFAGEELAVLVAEAKGLADFLEQLGLEIVFLLDPLDGLDRTSEPPELGAAGRSILEPEIRAIHEAYALAIAREIQPVYFGLASEINTLAAHGDPVLYADTSPSSTPSTSMRWGYPLIRYSFGTLPPIFPTTTFRASGT
jgi:hypothetical protein